MSNEKWTKKLQKWLSPEAAQKAADILTEESLEKLVSATEEVEKVKTTEKQEVKEKKTEEVRDSDNFGTGKVQRPIHIIPHATECSEKPRGYRFARDGKCIRPNVPVATVSNNPHQKAGRLDDGIKAKLDRLTEESKYYREKSQLDEALIGSLEDEVASLRRRIGALQGVLGVFKERCDAEFAPRKVEEGGLPENLERLFS